MPYIDENDKPALLAYNETTGLVEPVRVDPVLDALYVFGVTDGGGTYTAINRALIDENENSTLLAYNETTGLVESLRCSDDNELLVTPQ